MWRPVLFDSEQSYGAVYLCFSCGEKQYSPVRTDEKFQQFLDANASKAGCVHCGSQDFLFKNYKGHVFTVAHKLKDNATNQPTTN